MAFLELIGKFVIRRNLVGSDLMIVWAIALHLFEAGVFSATDKADGSIGMAGLLSVFQTHSLSASALIIGALFAAIGQWSGGIAPQWRFLLLIPQEGLLFITAMNAIVHVGQQHYADGVLRSWTFIFCDQAPRIGMPFLYAAAIYARVRAR